METAQHRQLRSSARAGCHQQALLFRVGGISFHNGYHPSIPRFVQVELTPMAIAAGRRLSDRLFGGLEGAKADYTNVPVRGTLLYFE